MMADERPKLQLVTPEYEPPPGVEGPLGDPPATALERSLLAELRAEGKPITLQALREEMS
jgi:hypothetical protein